MVDDTCILLFRQEGLVYLFAVFHFLYELEHLLLPYSPGICDKLKIRELVGYPRGVSVFSSLGFFERSFPSFQLFCSWHLLFTIKKIYMG